MRRDGLEAGTLLSVGAALLLWSSAFAGIKAGLRGFAPGELALLRFLTASSVLGVYALLSHMRLPQREDLGRIALGGLFGITVYHLALNYGETSVSAGAASLIIASGPVFTAILARFLLKERLTLWGWLGIAVAFSGVAAIARAEGGGAAFEPAAALVAVAAMSTAGYFVVSKPLLARYSPLEYTAYSMWMGTVPMLVFAPGLAGRLGSAPLDAVTAAVYLGVFPGALAYLLYSRALAKLPASVASSFLYVQPVLAAIIAWAWIGEIPRPLTVAGGAVALAGVALVTIKGRAATVT
ncbi:MAG: DMT family transporter [Anaerosomatales bacterium]|nr:DMT family transporter [Anaerosomatales bacterium]